MAKAFLITPFSAERAGGERPQIFCAVQHAVEAAALQAGVELVHPNEMARAGNIMEQVREEIESADVVLAILTGQNPNVFYELGLCHRPPILICRSRDDVPFDVRHLRYWTYGGAGELESLPSRLTTAIQETLREPQGVPYVQRQAQRSRIGAAPTPAGFVGRASRGPLTPQLVTSWDEYRRIYGPETDPSCSYLAYAVRGFFENGGTSAHVVRVCGAGAAAAWAQFPTRDPDQALIFEAATPGQWGNEVTITVHEATRAGLRIALHYPPGEDPDSEDYDNVGIDPLGPNYLADVINDSEVRLVRARWQDEGRAPATPVMGTIVLAGGMDGAPPGVDEFLGAPEAPTGPGGGLAALSSVEEVGLVCLPDAVNPALGAETRSALSDALIDHCERMGDRFGILGADAGISKVEDIPAPRDTSFAAMYFPWIRVADSRTRETLLVPPVGHIAGLYVRSDAEEGVHKAPVNQVVRGLARGTGMTEGPLGLAVTPEQQDALFRKGVNSVRGLGEDGSDVRVTTAITMAIDYKLRHVNSRRFMLFVRRAIWAGTAWVTFEPNGEPLWSRVREQIAAFMTQLWRDGALWGQTASEAFFVRCDKETMTADDLANGRLICLVGFALAGPPVSVMVQLVRQCQPADPSSGA